MLREGFGVKKVRPDCLTCGLCCSPHRDQETFCDLDEADLKRLDQKWVRRHVLGFSAFDRVVAAVDGVNLPALVIKTQWKKAATGPLRGFEARVCVALKGTLMHRVSCSIYPSALGLVGWQ